MVTTSGLPLQSIDAIRTPDELEEAAAGGTASFTVVGDSALGETACMDGVLSQVSSIS